MQFAILSWFVSCCKKSGKDLLKRILKLFSTDASYLLSKTPEDIEEEKTIKEICYKSGESLITDSPPLIIADNTMVIVLFLLFFRGVIQENTTEFRLLRKTT